uniref:Uncharacterized protein n=1 Tax=Hyaloperonospora arabidopsidis (strain Emoy2) TaxID=559515 RepID=M4BMT4_HYAAE
MSAWEQWGGKKPATSKLQGAQDALHVLMRSSALSTASTVGSESTGSVNSVFQKAWDSAREFTKGAVTAPKDATDTLESGQRDGAVDDASVAKSLFGRKSASNRSGLPIPTMSWPHSGYTNLGLTLQQMAEGIWLTTR